MKFSSPEFRQKFPLLLVRRGNQVHYRSKDLTEAENALVNSINGRWIAFPEDGVALNSRFKRARLLVGWRWNNSGDRFVHATMRGLSSNKQTTLGGKPQAAPTA